MKKVIRLTESDLIKLVKRVINEEMMSSGLTPEEKKSIQIFLNKIDCGLFSKYPTWMIDKDNEYYSQSFKPTLGNVGDIVRDSRCWDYNKNLCWSIFENGKKSSSTASFSIIKMKNGLYYRSYNRMGKGGYSPLIGNEMKAIKEMGDILLQQEPIQK